MKWLWTIFAFILWTALSTFTTPLLMRSQVGPQALFLFLAWALNAVLSAWCTWGMVTSWLAFKKGK